MPFNRPLKRLRKKTGGENLWIHILALLKAKPRYAYEIRDRVKERFGFAIGNVTAYMVLYKLEKDGNARARWEMKNGRQRKYYEITADGEKTLKAGIDYLSELTEKLGKLK